MVFYIAGAEQTTPEWLTAVLRQAGVLQQGQVEEVEYKKNDAFNSHLSHLTLRYSDDATPNAPTQLVLKRNIASEWGVEAGIDEVKFYDLIASLPDHPPITVPCYAAAYDEASGASYLLLLDLSETHRQPITRDQQIELVEGVPSPEDIAAVIDTMARLHAYWWGHPLLHAETFPVGYWSRNAERFESHLQRRTTSWQHLIATESSWFPQDLRELYESVFAHLRPYWERFLAPRFREQKHLTLIHGDAYFANFLCPKNHASPAPTYWLDWQSPSFDISGYDLVNLCATFWTSEQRNEGQREENILRQYHAALQRYGVSNYSWDELLTDYKLSLIFWLLMPVQDCYGGARKLYWWPKMQCLAAAFREWRCEELLVE
jgi:hypothetical protein